jgi:hypothetical protein
MDPQTHLLQSGTSAATQGNGVHVFNTLAQLEALMSKYINGSVEQPGLPQNTDFYLKKLVKESHGSSLMIQSTSFVIQKYMERPLLFNTRKFDIRVWVLFTHEMKVYLFRQGYVRTSSFAFTLGEDKIGDLSVHLTNNAVQKYNQDYCKYEKGNQLSFKSLRGLLEQAGKEWAWFVERMREIISLSAMAVRRRINRLDREGCFEIFGYDFMVDEIECRPWLI